ncbi:MAG: asparagine synthase-related protein, partial [Anaerolineae bacterium]
STYFACGCAREPSSPSLRQKLQALGVHAQICPIEGYGWVFFTTPDYADVAHSEQMIWIKLGHVHDGERLLTAQDMIGREWLTPDGVQVEAIQGSAALIGLAKHEPLCFIHRNLLSVPDVYYWTDPVDEVLVATDNLRLMIDLLPEPRLNEEVLPQHFLYRAVYGGQTYVQDVSELLVGEMLTWRGGTSDVELRRDLRALRGEKPYKPVDLETVSWFFEQLRTVVGFYLEGNACRSATMLSGGPDSSLLQVAINAQPDINRPYPSFSYVVDTPAFAFEVEYAQQSVRALGTDHTFVEIKPEAYPDWLIQCIEILGRPIPDDVRPCFLALADHISSRKRIISRLFHGHIADGLHGVQNSLEIVQGDRYRNWPVPLLKVLGIVLVPVSRSKSYGARKAAETLLARRDVNSPSHSLNSVGLYTDWELAGRCFSSRAVREALATKRGLQERYVDSDAMVEKANILDLVTDGIDPASVVRQLGLYCGREYIFPYGDEAILEATLSFDPVDRYTYDHRVKPILKLALESQVLLGVTNKPKGWSGVGQAELGRWMREGVLSDLVRGIERPSFIERVDFEWKVEQPDWFTWNLLTLDLFRKHVLA